MKNEKNLLGFSFFQTPNYVLVFQVILKNLVEQKPLISEDLEQWNQIYCCSYSHLN